LIEDYLQGRSIISIDKKIPSTSLRASPQTGSVIKRLLAAIVPSGDVRVFPASLHHRAQIRSAIKKHKESQRRPRTAAVWPFAPAIVSIGSALLIILIFTYAKERNRDQILLFPCVHGVQVGINKAGTGEYKIRLESFT
jgi:hypothetical protein